MQFTPQQLTGGPKYNHVTRIGNWSEDQELEELRLKDYLKKKETGTLCVTQKQKQIAECMTADELSATPDGVIRFGNKVQLANHQSSGFLSVNPYDACTKAHEAFMLTTSANGNPSVRNVFQIERVDADDDGFDPNDDVVHYGQNVWLILAPFSKIQKPAFMHSELVTALAAAKFSRHQEVTAMVQPSGETKWQLLFPDVNARPEMEGEAVPAGSPLVVKHVQTGSFLASDQIPYQNLFGQEFEVHCFPYFSLNKTQNLVGEKKGELMGDAALRKHGLPNIWSILSDTHGKN